MPADMLTAAFNCLDDGLHMVLEQFSIIFVLVTSSQWEYSGHIVPSNGGSRPNVSRHNHYWVMICYGQIPRGHERFFSHQRELDPALRPFPIWEWIFSQVNFRRQWMPSLHISKPLIRSI